MTDAYAPAKAQMLDPAAQATKALRRAGYKAGLIGASKRVA